jgi:hypothetical protein
MQDSAAILGNRHDSRVSRSLVGESRSFRHDSETGTLSIQEYGTCLHGFLLGLCIEGGLALALYGLYVVGHMIQ